MEFQDYFPVWEKLTSVQQQQLKGSAVSRTVKRGTVLHNGNLDCTGLLLIRHGQLRSYILSDEGREITLYRLFDRDICLFSASCMMRSIQFEMMIEAEKDTELWIVPAEIYQSIMQESAPVSNFTNEIMATRFSEVIWLMEQIILDPAQPQRVVRRLRLQYNRDWLAQLFLRKLVKIRRNAASQNKKLFGLRRFQL